MGTLAHRIHISICVAVGINRDTLAESLLGVHQPDCIVHIVCV